MKASNHDNTLAGRADRAGNGTTAAALEYIEAYGAFNTLWAYRRLKGWNGERPELEPDIVAAELKMREALETLHVAVSGEGRPNYTERARRRIVDEQQR